MERGLRWALTSAERAASYRQTYLLARQKLLQRAESHAAGTWAVVMDADETILDNAEFRVRMALKQARWPESKAAWTEWVQQRRAIALPGASEFIGAVRMHGGRVFVVTNRNEQQCGATLQNIAALGITVDGVLCKSNSDDDKNGRFASILDGAASPDGQPIVVLGYIGDSIGDFPSRSQANPEPWDDFGETLFVLPNPMYGTWEQNDLCALDIH